MKKMICLLMIAVLLFSLIACGKEEKQNKPTEESTATTPFSCPPSDGYDGYEFDSYEAIYKAMCDSESEDHKMLVSEGQRHIETYQNPCLAQIMEAFEDGTASLIVPATKEGLMPLRISEDRPIVKIMSREAYELTWIWYHCRYNDRYLRMEVTYPEVFLGAGALNDVESIVDVTQILMPILITPEEFYPGITDTLLDMYEQNITVNGTTELSALFFEEVSGTEVWFMWEGALVILHTFNNEALTDEFWEDFRVQVYNG